MMSVAYAVPAELPPCTERAVPSPCAQPAGAYRHDGFYFRLSGGLHYTAFGGSGPGRDISIHGATNSALLALGGSVADGVVLAGVLGGETVRGTFHGAPSPEGNATASLVELGMLLDWFPNPADGWHVGALAAIGGVTLTDSRVSDSSGAAFAATLLGGYDWWIGPEWSLGIMAVFSAATTAPLKDADRNDIGYRLGALSAGLNYSFTLH